MDALPIPSVLHRFNALRHAGLRLEPGAFHSFTIQSMYVETDVLSLPGPFPGTFFFTLAFFSIISSPFS